MSFLLWIEFSSRVHTSNQVCLRKIGFALGTLRSLSRRGGWEFPAIQLQKITSSYFYLKTLVSVSQSVARHRQSKKKFLDFLKFGEKRTSSINLNGWTSQFLLEPPSCHTQLGSPIVFLYNVETKGNFIRFIKLARKIRRGWCGSLFHKLSFKDNKFVWILVFSF